MHKTPPGLPAGRRLERGVLFVFGLLTNQLTYKGGLAHAPHTYTRLQAVPQATTAQCRQVGPFLLRQPRLHSPVQAGQAEHSLPDQRAGT